jgi:hypothetical protein
MCKRPSSADNNERGNRIECREQHIWDAGTVNLSPRGVLDQIGDSRWRAGPGPLVCRHENRAIRDSEVYK